jgi:hypothetical protein
MTSAEQFQNLPPRKLPLVRSLLAEFMFFFLHRGQAEIYLYGARAKLLLAILGCCSGRASAARDIHLFIRLSPHSLQFPFCVLSLSGSHRAVAKQTIKRRKEKCAVEIKRAQNCIWSCPFVCRASDNIYCNYLLIAHSPTFTLLALVISIALTRRDALSSVK